MSAVTTEEPVLETERQRPRARSYRSPMGWAGLLLILVLALVLFVYPVVMLILGAFRTAPPGAGGTWSLKGFIDAYTDPALPGTLRNSVILAVAEMILTNGVALFFCWVVARTTTPLRKLVTPMMALIFAMPTLYFTIAWGMIGNKEVGFLNKGFDMITGSGAHPVNINSWWGIIFVVAIKGVASSYILLIGPFLAMDRSLEEASMVSGASRIRTFFRVNMPVLGPAITGLLILSFVVGLGQLDTPLILGTPARIDFFATAIFSALNNGAVPEYAPASALSLMLVAIILILVAIQRRALKGKEFTTVTGKAYRQDPWEIGKWRWACTGAIVLYAILAFILPFAQLIVGSLQPVLGLWDKYNLNNYRQIFDQDNLVQAFQGTFTVSIIGGLIAMLAVVTMDYVGRHNPGKIMRFVSFSTWLPWALPGVVLGLAMSWAYLSIPVVQQLYGTVWIVMIALIVTVIPIAARASEGSISQVSRELEESARTSGATNLRTVVGIVGRLILPSFMAGWFLTALIISGSFDVPVLLSSSTNPTVPVIVYQLYTQGEMSMAAAVFCMLLYVIAAAILAFALLRFAARHLVRRWIVAWRLSQTADPQAGPVGLESVGAPAAVAVADSGTPGGAHNG